MIMSNLVRILRARVYTSLQNVNELPLLSIHQFDKTRDSNIFQHEDATYDALETEILLRNDPSPPRGIKVIR